jgi:hypothetical protein
LELHDLTSVVRIDNPLLSEPLNGIFVGLFLGMSKVSLKKDKSIGT